MHEREGDRTTAGTHVGHDRAQHEHHLERSPAVPHDVDAPAVSAIHGDATRDQGRQHGDVQRHRMPTSGRSRRRLGRRFVVERRNGR